jgi:hypothetical protein
MLHQATSSLRLLRHRAHARLLKSNRCVSCGSQTLPRHLSGPLVGRWPCGGLAELEEEKTHVEEGGDDIWAPHVMQMERGAVAGVFHGIRKYKRL